MGGLRQKRGVGGRLHQVSRRFTPEQIDKLSNAFLSIRSPKELCDLLSLTRDELLLVYNPEYDSFIHNKNGKKRIIYKPEPRIRDIQRDLLAYLNSVYLSSLSANNYPSGEFIFSSVYAYIPAREIISSDQEKHNIVENAKSHVGCKLLLNIDLENFFQGITDKSVKEVFTRWPFNFDEQLAVLLSKIVTYNGILPTGAPTSPIVSNFIAIELDKQLSLIPNLTYSRYSDDLTFSTNYYSEETIKNIIKLLQSIIENNGFKLNKQKLKLAKNTDRQEVTGIVINQKLNVRRTYIRNIRAILHSIEIYGWEKASGLYIQKIPHHYFRAINNLFSARFFMSHEVVENCILGGSSWFTSQSLRSKIEHIGYVRGKEDPIYINLKNRFYSLKAERKELKAIFQPDSSVAYVTNATANSIVYYVYNFLIQSGYSESEIADLKKRFKNEQDDVSFEMLLGDFKNQSAYFFKLITLISSKEETNLFGQDTSNMGLFNSSKYNRITRPKAVQYFRRVFHTSPLCQQIQSDYDEKDGKFRNTGVFSEQLVIKKPQFYVLQREFLEKLGMRVCRVCGSDVALFL